MNNGEEIGDIGVGQVGEFGARKAIETGKTCYGKAEEVIDKMKQEAAWTSNPQKHHITKKIVKVHSKTFRLSVKN